METVTVEERVRRIRAAVAGGDRSTAEHHFTTLLQQSSKSTERWLRRVIAMTPAIQNASAYPVSDDLRQELALYLWKRLADPARHEPAWEHMYWRALIYAQRHVATHYMREAGYWVDSRALAQGRQGVASLSIEYERMEWLEAPDALSVAERDGDVQAALLSLPPKQRAAVVLRYWRGMRERDIGLVLGCSDRAVRTLLRQAEQRLRTWYEGLAHEGSAAHMQLVT